MPLFKKSTNMNYWSTQGGVYMMASEIKGKLWPEYIGYTAAQTFEKRINQHEGTGKVWQNLHQKQKKKVHFLTYPLSPAMAQCVESLFLQHFDFAMNTYHNDKQRYLNVNIPLVKPEDGAKMIINAINADINGFHSIINNVKGLSTRNA